MLDTQKSYNACFNLILKLSERQRVPNLTSKADLFDFFHDTAQGSGK